VRVYGGAHRAEKRGNPSELGLNPFSAAAPPPAAAAVSSAAPAAAPTTQESALDRMLGIQEDAPPARKEEPKDTEAPKVTVSDDVIKELMDVSRPITH
jgi:hypothetical protein